MLFYTEAEFCILPHLWIVVMSELTNQFSISGHTKTGNHGQK